jgi:hypothetical protein
MGYLAHSLSDSQRNANLTSNNMTWMIRVTWSSSMSGVMGLRSSDFWSPTLALALPLFWSTVALNPRQGIQVSVCMVLSFVITTQSSPGAHAVSRTMGTASLWWRKSGSGWALNTHPRLLLSSYYSSTTFSAKFWPSLPIPSIFFYPGQGSSNLILLISIYLF